MTDMYKKIVLTMQIALMAALAMLLAGCHPEDVSDRVPLNIASPAGSQLQNGDEQQERANVMMRVPAYESGDLFVPGTGSGDDVSQVSKYLPYNKLYPSPINKAYTTIGAFLAQDSKDSYDALAGFFQWKDQNSWTTTVGIKPGDFYIFGYMPSNVGSVSAKIEKLEVGDVDYMLAGKWSDGAKMTISNLSTVTPADVCVVVGVLKATVPNPKPDLWTPSPIYDNSVVQNLRQGQYAYHGEDKDNYVYLLLDHLYTNVNMELSVEEKYAELRTIVLTSVFMKTPVRETVDAVITLTNSPTKPIDDISFTAPTGGTPTNAQIFPALPEYKQVVAVEGKGVTSIPGYFAPGLTTQDFEFEFHYDVYDKEGEDLSNPENLKFGNCVRKDCVAINKWKLPGTGVQNGKSFKVTATIRPTYLFMLSDPDLDNPTVELNSVTN